MTQQLLFIAGQLVAGSANDSSLSTEDHRARFQRALELSEELIRMCAARERGRRKLSLNPSPSVYKPDADIKHKVAERLSESSRRSPSTNPVEPAAPTTVNNGVATDASSSTTPPGIVRFRPKP